MKYAVALALAAVSCPALAASDCKVTKAQYEAISHGMNYTEAVTILGCDGEELSSSDIGGIRTVMLMWSGKNIGGNMNAMFQDGRMVQKAQFGLR